MRNERIIIEKKMWKGSIARSFAAFSLVLAVGCNHETILEGERFSTRTDLRASIPTKENPHPTDIVVKKKKTQSEPISLPPPVQGDNWTHRAANVRHNPPHNVLSDRPTLRWSAVIGKGDVRKNRITAAPVVFAGRVFTMDSVGLVVATEVDQGRRLWQQSLAPAGDRRQIISGGGLAVGEDGRLFATTGYGEVIALNATEGSLLWRQRLDSPASSAPTVFGGNVYASTTDGTSFAINASDGRVLWSIPGGVVNTTLQSGASPAVLGQNVVFPLASGELVSALRVNGEIRWRVPLSGKRNGYSYLAISNISGDPVISDGVVFAGNLTGYMVAVNFANGKRLWTVEEGALHPPLVVDDAVFVVTDLAELARFDKHNGEMIWSVQLPEFSNEEKREETYSHYGPVLAGGHLVVASSDGFLRLFSPKSGELVYQADIVGGAATLPALAHGKLYVVSRDGELMAFH